MIASRRELKNGYALIHARGDEEFSAASLLFREYANSLTIDLCFQGFEKELENLKAHYDLPDGGLLLIQKVNDYVGCAAIRKLDDQTGELKRMYIQPSHRGQKLGEGLLAESLIMAGNLGYNVVKLDTLKTMTSAIKLYKAAGFWQTDAYCYNPSEDVVYMEIKLR